MEGTNVQAPDWHSRRAELKARDAQLDTGRAHVPAGGPTDEAAIEAEAVQACREVARERGPLLLVTSQRVEDALVRIMRDTGFTAAQIRGRFHGRRDVDGNEGP